MELHPVGETQSTEWKTRRKEWKVQQLFCRFAFCLEIMFSSSRERERGIEKELGSWFDFNFHLDVVGCQIVSEDNEMLSLQAGGLWPGSSPGNGFEFDLKLDFFGTFVLYPVMWFVAAKPFRGHSSLIDKFSIVSRNDVWLKFEIVCRKILRNLRITAINIQNNRLHNKTISDLNCFLYPYPTWIIFKHCMKIFF